MRIAYFDCFSGVSGDMCLVALVSVWMGSSSPDANSGRSPATFCNRGR